MHLGVTPVIQTEDGIFKVGDIVKLKGHSREIIGKITHMESGSIGIDCSTRFKACTRVEKLGDFYSIELFCSEELTEQEEE